MMLHTTRCTYEQFCILLEGMCVKSFDQAIIPRTMFALLGQRKVVRKVFDVNGHGYLDKSLKITALTWHPTVS